MVENKIKNIFLLTNTFPYGKGETFLEAEIQYISKAENVTVYICPVAYFSPKSSPRIIPDNVKVISVYELPFITKLIQLISMFFDVNFYKEIIDLCKSKKLNIKNFKQVVFYYFSSKKAYKKILNEYSHIFSDASFENIIYSYWLATPGLTGAFLKNKYPNFKFVSRCHGFDFNKNRAPGGYIPFIDYTFKKLNKLYPASNFATKYIKENYENAPQTNTHFLGTNDYGNKDYTYEEEILIVSCAIISPLKRITLLIDALNKVSNKKIRWVHFGGGFDIEEVVTYAGNTLPIDFKFEFKGMLDNNKVHEFYKNNNVYAFIHTSSTEGGPVVAIMEALSHSIPVIATNAGGNEDSVINGYNGIMLENNCTAEKLANTIDEFINLEKQDYLTFRKNARKCWESKFNATTNFEKFYNIII